MVIFLPATRRFGSECCCGVQPTAPGGCIQYSGGGRSPELRVFVEQGGNGLGELWSGEQVPLTAIAAEGEQLGGLGPAFDAFADHTQMQRLHQRDDALHYS